MTKKRTYRKTTTPTKTKSGEWKFTIWGYEFGKLGFKRKYPTRKKAREMRHFWESVGVRKRP